MPPRLQLAAVEIVTSLIPFLSLIVTNMRAYQALQSMFMQVSNTIIPHMQVQFYYLVEINECGVGDGVSCNGEQQIT